jgi:hypothetical protein
MRRQPLLRQFRPARHPPTCQCQHQRRQPHQRPKRPRQVRQHLRRLLPPFLLLRFR